MHDNEIHSHDLSGYILSHYIPWPFDNSFPHTNVKELLNVAPVLLNISSLQIFVCWSESYAYVSTANAM